MRSRLLPFTALPIAAVLAAVAVACGSDSSAPASGDGGPAVVSSGGGLVDPNARLTFDGRTYRLVSVEQANLVASDVFEAIGRVSTVNVNTGADVFARSGDDGAIYTYSPEVGDAPATWLRWVPLES